MPCLGDSARPTGHSPARWPWSTLPPECTRSTTCAHVLMPAALYKRAGAGCDVAAGMQTEPSRPSRPASAAKQPSYFDRLVLSNASRQAGQAASGGEQ